VLAAGLPPLCGCAGLPATGGERHTTRPAAAQAPPAEERARLERLVASYPDHLAGIQDDWLLWSDGARVPIGAGQPPRRFEEMLRNATIADQLRQRYAPGPLPAPPPRDHSPGRLRNAAFFARMYGECRQGATQPLLRPVTWMPRSRPQRLNVTTVNGIATRLERVIEALEALPDPVRAYLVPSPGAFACRSVADTGQPSMHAYGAAIDIAVRHADYWLWARSADEPIHRNRIPAAIVEAFEAERFIWGGKWYHYDTMHFEYRPELFEA
jgi:hypothetical protein